jgi:uncharacterized linocin/CFP29 family protein
MGPALWISAAGELHEFREIRAGTRQAVSTPGDLLFHIRAKRMDLCFELAAQMPLPGDVRQYPDAIAQALSQLRLVGVTGPYAVLLGAEAYTALAETSDQGYPVLEHVKRLVDDKIIWAPAIEGNFLVTTRGGDFELHIGQDVSIGYLGHTDTAVRLYLQETFTFLLLTSEAAVALIPSAEAETA